MRSMRRSMVAIAALTALAVAGCAGQLGADPSMSQNPTTSTVPANTDGPSDELAQVVQRYGDAHRDEFAGVYFDHENGGRLVARFTGHVELHQRALDALVGSRGRVVVLLAGSPAKSLQGIADSAFADYKLLAKQGIALMTGGVDVIHNVVELDAKSDNPRAEEILKAYGPPGSVVVHLYPADKPWTQPAEGPGWRLLGVFDTDLPYTVAVAVDDAALVAEWQRYRLPGIPPAWDPSRDVVIILSEGIGSSCRELRLDAVVMDAAARLVHGEFSDPHAPEFCTLDLVGGKTFVVAVARGQLPPSPFTLRLHTEPMACEPDCARGPTTLKVDLR